MIHSGAMRSLVFGVISSSSGVEVVETESAMLPGDRLTIGM